MFCIVHLAANPLYERPVEKADVQATLQQYGLAHGFLLFVGTLEPRKNLPMLLRVYARLRQEKGITAPQVLVGGKGWLYEDVFATIDRLDLAGCVRHLSDVTDLQLAHLYHSAGALLTPSLYEGFGLPALEAQHCGCPALVSDRGSLPEIVGEKGLAIDPDDEDAWVEATARVLSDVEFRVATIANGFEQSKQFSWSDTAAKTLALYLGKD
jgi:glycosyltransferase involved in cell wall biosynthesis